MQVLELKLRSLLAESIIILPNHVVNLVLGFVIRVSLYSPGWPRTHTTTTTTPVLVYRVLHHGNKLECPAWCGMGYWTQGFACRADTQPPSCISNTLVSLSFNNYVALGQSLVLSQLSGWQYPLCRIVTGTTLDNARIVSPQYVA